jgi:penicillin-binding protein 1B
VAPGGPLRRLLIRATAILGALLAVGALGAGVVAFLSWGAYRAERDAFLPELHAHLRHERSHPGWSFPARIWSAPAPLDLPFERLVAHARARGYAPACPSDLPGTYCEVDRVVTPRAPHPTQPSPGLEPVLLGWYVGPDAELRDHLPRAEAPPHLIAAILASEDANFEDHVGVDLLGLARASIRNASAGGYAQGGSTLAMQVVRGITGERRRSLGRKVTEAMRAVALDRELGKDGVLQLYLDMPYLGQRGSSSICGFEMAAWHYYGVSARDLSVAQAATLAGILPAPGLLAPDRHPERARERRDRVLRLMADRGWDVAEALAEPIAVSPGASPEPVHPAYLAVVHAELARLPETVRYGAGLHVHTALDVVAQRESEGLLAAEVLAFERLIGRRHAEPLRAAGALLDPRTGHVVAAVDTAQEAPTDFSRIVHARRQPGSSFKPVVYALAVEQRHPDGRWRFTASTTLPNTHRRFPTAPTWYPRNVGGRYGATASIAHALRSSANIASASLLLEAGGPEALIPFARRLGFQTEHFPNELGLALGQGEVTALELGRFVATLTRAGRQAPGTAIVSARDRLGGERAPPFDAPIVLDPDAAVLTRDLMSLVVSWGTGGAARGVGGRGGVQGPAIGKTGTSDDERDLWFIGATPHHVGVLWLGYDQPTRIGASASDLAAPLWGWWLRAVDAHLPTATFDPPPLDRTWICTLTGHRPGPGCESVPAPYLAGTAPGTTCDGQHPPESVADTGPRVGLFTRIADAEARAREAAARTDEGEAGGGPDGEDGR